MPLNTSSVCIALPILASSLGWSLVSLKQAAAPLVLRFLLGVENPLPNSLSQVRKLAGQSLALRAPFPLFQHGTGLSILALNLTLIAFLPAYTSAVT